MDLTHDQTTFSEDLKAGFKAVSEKIAHRFKGDAGILAELAMEHGKLQALLDEIDRKQINAKHRLELLQLIRIELLSHNKAEEQTFYAELSAAGEPMKIDHSAQEHRKAEELLRLTMEADQSGSEWEPTFRSLKSAIEMHVKEEEKDRFEEAKRTLSKDNLKTLKEQFKTLKQKEKERLQRTQAMG